MSDTNRAKATFKEIRKHSEKIDAYGYDSKPSVILNQNPSDGQSIADRELKRMVNADVFRSADETIKQTNSNKRRYK